MGDDYCRLRDHLLSQGCDPSLLALCCVNKGLLERSKVGGELLTVNQRVTGKVGFSTGFIQAAKKDTDILKVTPFRPKMYFQSRTKAGALDGLSELLLQSKVAVVQAFLLQTAAGKKDHQNYRFIAFQSWRDGVIYLNSIQTEGYMVCGTPPEIVDVVTLFELQRKEERIITGLILDWELPWSAFKDADGVHRQTVEEATQIAQTFPMFTYQRMLQHRVVDQDQRVCCLVKNKCRPMAGGNFKISFHFIFRIYGRGVEHQTACNKMFSDIIPLLASYKALGRLPDDADLSKPCWGLDKGVWTGNQPFSLSNSRKVIEDPLPFLQCEISFRRGKEEQCIAIPPLSEEVPLRVKQIARACYTIPSFSANYSDQFLQACAVQNEVSGNRTQTLGHQTTSQGGARKRPPFDEQLLPCWYPKSAKEMVRLDTALPCLHKYAVQIQEAVLSDMHSPNATSDTLTTKTTAPNATGETHHPKATDPSATGDTLTPNATDPNAATGETHPDKAICFRATNIVCPYKLYTEGKLDIDKQVHRSNGIFVGIIPGQSAVLYAKCSHCQFPSMRAIPSKVLRGGWIQVTEGDMKTLLKSDTHIHIQGTLLVNIVVGIVF